MGPASIRDNLKYPKEETIMSNLFPITRFGTGGLGLTRDFDDVIDAFFGRPLRASSRTMNFSTVPKANVAKTQEGYSIELAAPGFSRDDFDINVSDGTLTINTAVPEDSEKGSDPYTTREYSYTTFSRSWSLPENVNSASITARYDAGILNVSVPLEAMKSENLTIDVD